MRIDLYIVYVVFYTYTMYKIESITKNQIPNQGYCNLYRYLFLKLRDYIIVVEVALKRWLPP